MLFLGTIMFFCYGMLAEIIGVKYGFIFGKYNYGEALGLKIYASTIYDWESSGVF